MSRAYFAAVAPDHIRMKPGELPGAIGIISDRDKPGSIVGIAYECPHLGGWRVDYSVPGYPSEDLGRMKATWRLVIGKQEVELAVGDR